MRVLGIDPGATGALAVVDGLDLVALHDMPFFEVSRGRGKRKEVDVRTLAEILASVSVNAIYMEKVGGMTGDGAAEAFQFGRSAGAAEALAKQLGARFVFVTPPVWKRAMGLIGTAKDDARHMASNLWPAKAAEFARKKDDGRADAALVAEYGRRALADQGVFG